MPHTWDPDHYLTFADERGRPFVELLARIGTICLVERGSQVLRRAGGVRGGIERRGVAKVDDRPDARDSLGDLRRHGGGHRLRGAARRAEGEQPGPREAAAAR